MEKVKNLFKNKAFLIALVGVVSLSIIATGTYAWFTTSSEGDAAGAALTAAELGVELTFETNDDDNAIKLLPGENEYTTLKATLENTGNREIIAKVNLAADGVTVVLADGTEVDLADYFKGNSDYFNNTFSTGTNNDFGTYGDNLILPEDVKDVSWTIIDGYLYVYLDATETVTVGVNGELTYGIAGKSYNQNILQGATIDLTTDEEGNVGVQAVQATEDAVKEVFGTTVATFFFPPTP